MSVPQNKKEKERKEEMKKMNNKGFSLVELIIVIAIMAVLIVVLAPQYLKYVEKSRNSTDVTNATELVTALQVYASDPDATIPIPASGTITLVVTGTADVAITDVDGFAAAALKEAGLTNATGAVTTRAVSRTNWTAYTIEGKAGNGNLTFTYKATGSGSVTDADATKAFQDAMTGVKKAATE